MLISLSKGGAATWWDSQTKTAQTAYLAKHPRSKFKMTAQDKKVRHPGVKTMVRASARQLLLDADTEPLVRNKHAMRRSLQNAMSPVTKAKLASVYNGLDASSTGSKRIAQKTDSQSLGLMLKKLGDRPRSNAVYRDVLTRMFRPKDAPAFSTLLGSSMSLSKMALVLTLGAASIANPLVAAAVGAYFVNSLLDSVDNHKPKKIRRVSEAQRREEKNMSRKAVREMSMQPDDGEDDLEDDEELESRSNSFMPIDPVDRLVSDFISFWGTLDIPTLKEKVGVDESSSDVMASESAAFVDKQLTPEQEQKSRLRMTLRTCPTQHGIPKELKRRFLICINGAVRGFLSWDTSQGTPSKDAFGWRVTLYHGFNESSYRSGRNPDRPMEPFTAVHSGELKLHNPCKMPFALARAWARQQLRR